MSTTPWENFRRWVVSSPPWVIFAISLTIMAIGVLVLAYTLKGDSEYKIQPHLSVAHFCLGVENKDDVSPSNDSKISTLISISLGRGVFSDLVNKSATHGVVRWTGSLRDGQLGIRSADANATMPFEVVLGQVAATPTCVDEACHKVILQSCAIVYNAIEELPHQTDHEYDACENLISGNAQRRANQLLHNQADTSNDGGCKNGSAISIQRRDSQSLVVVPLLHDTLTARLHLLYTSYFLFTTILLLIMYAAFRRASHSKQANRSPENNSSHYSKLRNDRE